MALNLHALAGIIEVSKTGSISKASQNLFLSQPHLSNMIKSVEQEIGIILFQRSARGVILTDDGKRFVQQAQKILTQVDDLETMFYLRPNESVRLNVSVTRSYQVSLCISRFINQHSHKQQFLVRVKETNPFEVLHDVRCRSADFGVLHVFEPQLEYFVNCFKSYDIAYEQSYDRPFLLALSTTNPLAQAPTITNEMLAEQMMVTYGDYEAPDASFHVVNEVSDIIMSQRRVYVYDRSSAMETLSRCANAYMWITGLHDDTLRQYGLVLRKCPSVSIRNIGFSIYPATETLSSDAAALLQDLKKINWSENIR